MSNSDSNSDPTSTPNPAKSSGPAARPHRRLSLLQSTQDAAPVGTAANQDPRQDATPLAPESISPSGEADQSATDSPATSTVRVMAYLSVEEARVLDETWLKLRSQPSRPSKSDILRAACTLATQDFELLAAILTQQQSSTLSRQRNSKVRKT